MTTIDRDIRISTVGRDDYPELEGKIIDYIWSSGKVHKAIVVGCNRSVGVTIVAVDNKDQYHVCMTGPVSPTGTQWEPYYYGTYDELFDWVVEAIKEGVIYAKEMEAQYVDNESYLGGPDGSSCAYSQ